MMIVSNLLRAFMWEMSKNWHLLLLGILGGVLPLFLFLWLLTSVGLPIESPEFIRTHAFLMPFSFLALFFGIIGIQGSVRRLYSYPLSDSTIALWHMLTGIAMIAGGISLIILGLNVHFRTGWPILGPTLYFVMAFAVLQPFARIAYKTVSTIITIPIIVLILIFGFLTRYSIVRSQPSLWSELSLLELCIFGGVTIWSILLFNRSVKLDRHNLGKSDPLVELWMRVESWIRNQLPRFGSYRSELRNDFAAHCWFLWRLNRSHFYLNVIVLFVACIFYAISTEQEAASSESRLMYSGVHFFTIVLSTVLATTMGIGLGSSNADSTPSRDKVTFEEKLQNMSFLTMGSFLSTLPISNTRLSNTILLTAFRGVLTPTLLYLIAAGIFLFLGMDFFSDLWRSGHFGLYCLLLLTVPWTAIGMTATVCLIGNNRFLQASTGLLTAGLVLILLPSTRPLTILLLAVSTGLATVFFLAIRIFRAARQPKRSLASEDWIQIGLAICLWLVLLTFSWQLPELKSMESFKTGFVLLSSVSVLPIAAMPLAICINRTR